MTTTTDHRLPWERLAAAGDLRAAVVEYVRAYDWVTFVELVRQLEPYMPVRGDMAMTLSTDPNCVFWANMSDELVSLLADLTENELIFFHGSCHLTYMIDGGTLGLPIARSRPRNGYKKPHWLPVCFRTVPLEAKKKRGKP